MVKMTQKKTHVGREVTVNLREQLAEKKPLIGTHLTTRDSHWAELMGTAAFDYYWVCMEHTELTLPDVYNILTAAKASLHRPKCFVRIPENNPTLVKPLLEMGPDGIIFPMIKTADDVRLAVASCMYPPNGIRGWCPRRINNYGLEDTKNYLNTVDARIAKLIQIETREAVENLDEILTVEGVDAFIIGPCDLSASLGHIMELDHPEVVDAIEKVISKVHAANKFIGVSVGGYDTENIALWLRRNVDLISVGGEIMYVYDCAHQTVCNFNKACELCGRDK